MADAFSHLVSSLGYMRRQEREVLSAMFGRGPGEITALPSHEGGVSSATPSLPSSHISALANGGPGLHVRAVKMSPAAQSTATTNPVSAQPSRSASGTAVASALSHPRPAVTMQPTRSVATPSGGSRPLRPVAATVHPMMRPSGSVVVPMENATPVQSAPSTSPSVRIPPPIAANFPSNSGATGGGTYTAQPPLDDGGGSGSGVETGAEATGTAASSTASTTVSTAVTETGKKMPWLLLGVGAFAAWLFFK